MGKPTGFMEFGRRAIENRPPLERIRDWREAHPPLDQATLTQQAARCMDCGVPFCHTGTLISGVASGCPINNLIPEWNDLVYRGQWREASLRLHRTNNFPEFTGRVCPAPCEGSCTVAINGDPVAIKTIEQEIADRAWENGWVVPNPPAQPIRTGGGRGGKRSGRAGGRGAAQPGRPPRHGLRARGPDRAACSSTASPA
jgi:glutamate synthase (NADPH/NADH) small chain